MRQRSFGVVKFGQKGQRRLQFGGFVPARFKFGLGFIEYLFGGRGGEGELVQANTVKRGVTA